MPRLSLALASTPVLAAVLAAGLAAAPGVVPLASAAPAAPAQAKVAVTSGCLASVPELGSTTKVKICYTVFKPAGASRTAKVPLLFHSHGWAGSRTTDPADFKRFLNRGYGLLSFDQRGFGASGGQAHVENPAYEGQDVRKLVDLVARLPWVQLDAPGDPRMGAIGGSYGGGYQFLGAYEEQRLKGKPLFDALAPEITWRDLEESLAPSGVVRTAWALALSGAAVPSNALPTSVYQALAEGAATGTFPKGQAGLSDLSKFFARNGPKYHNSQGRRLDIPVLFGQGTTDSLFPLEQGIHNFQRAITARARRHSIFIGYNGGHVLPAALPQGVNVTSDPCSRQLAGSDFQGLSIRFFDEQLKHRTTGLTGYRAYHIATPASTCTTVRSVAATKTYAVGNVATTETAGAPVGFAVARGPIRVAGLPFLTGKVTALGVNNRAFYGLAVGTSPATAHLVQNNVLPFNSVAPVNGAARRIALPGVAVNVPKGQTLYLLASPVSDTFVGMGSRTPGAVLIQDTVVHLPVVPR